MNQTANHKTQSNRKQSQVAYSLSHRKQSKSKQAAYYNDSQVVPVVVIIVEVISYCLRTNAFQSDTIKTEKLIAVSRNTKTSKNNP